MRVAFNVMQAGQFGVEGVAIAVTGITFSFKLWYCFGQNQMYD